MELFVIHDLSSRMFFYSFPRGSSSPPLRILLSRPSLINLDSLYSRRNADETRDCIIPDTLRRRLDGLSPFRDSCRRPCSSVTRSISFFSAWYCETLPRHTRAHTQIQRAQSFFTGRATLSNFKLSKFLISLVVTVTIRLPRFLTLIFSHFGINYSWC